jgi:hypothetical protein
MLISVANPIRLTRSRGLFVRAVTVRVFVENDSSG